MGKLDRRARRQSGKPWAKLGRLCPRKLLYLDAEAEVVCKFCPSSPPHPPKEQVLLRSFLSPWIPLGFCYFGHHRINTGLTQS